MSDKPTKSGSKISAFWKNWKGLKPNKKSNNEGDLAVKFVNENAAHRDGRQQTGHDHRLNRSNFYDAPPTSNLHNAIRRDLRPGQHRPPRDPNDESYFNGHRSKLVVKSSIGTNADHTGYIQAVLTKANKLSAPTHPLLIHPTDDCIVPDLYRITSLSFFWQDLDHFKAEKLLADKPEGSFLLRISSHDNYLFSVSFRSHNRSLHARIEKENNLYSFDAKDAESQKFASICELFEKYRESKRYLFEPVLTHPLNNPNRHTLKQLSQYAIISMCNYHHIDRLPLPQTLKDYLKSFNYCSDNLR